MGANAVAGLSPTVPRKLRENLPDGIYHVFSRGNNREPIYRDDIDRRLYLRRLGRVSTRLEWRILAFCLMPNHVHLLLQTPRANLSTGMQTLHGAYALVFNMRHNRVGHVFQGRYGAVRMTTDAQVCAAAGYIARNPVRAGLAETVGEWPWDSYTYAMAGGGPDWLDKERLLAFFGSETSRARRSYAEMSA